LDLRNNADGLTLQATQRNKELLEILDKKENQKSIIPHVTSQIINVPDKFFSTNFWGSRED
jgi:hypothetical protein